MIKKIAISIFLFLLFYLDSIYLGPIKWAQLWKGCFILIMMGLWIFKKKKSAKVFTFYFYMVFFYFLTPFLFTNFNHILIKSIENLFFPSTFLFLHYLTRNNHNYTAFLSFISVFFIASFTPFYFNIIPELGKTYDLELLGLTGQSGISGLFQQPHAASFVLAYSTLTLVYVIQKTRSKSLNAFLIFMIILATFFQLLTYARLGLLMTLVGFIYMYAYQLNLVKMLKFSLIVIVGILISASFIKETQSYESMKLRFYGQSKFSDNSTFSGELNYNEISSGRLTIWSSSLENVIHPNNVAEFLLGITELELTERNEKKINLAVFSHNAFIDSLVTNGLIGFIIFILFLITWFKLILQIKLPNFKNSIDQKFCLTIFIIYLVSLFFQGGVIIYEGIFISFSLLLLFNKRNVMLPKIRTYS